MICTFLWGNDQFEKLSEIKSPLVTEGYVLLNIEWWRTYTSAKFVSVLPQSVAFSSWNPFVQKKETTSWNEYFFLASFLLPCDTLADKDFSPDSVLTNFCKGQLISKGLFKVFICTKNERKYFCISALDTKKKSNKKIKALYTTNWRILFWLSYITFLIWPLFID